MTFASAPDSPPAWGMVRLSAPSTVDSDHRMTRWSQLCRIPMMRWRKSKAKIDVTAHGQTSPVTSAVRTIPAAEETRPRTMAGIGLLTASTKAPLEVSARSIATTAGIP